MLTRVSDSIAHGSRCLQLCVLVGLLASCVRSSLRDGRIQSGVAIVTGGCGLIGSHVAIHLADRGLDVVVTTRGGDHELACLNKFAVLQAGSFLQAGRVGS